MAKQDITVCIDAYPDPDTDVFRIGAADDILRLLVDAHDTEFSIPELVDATGVTRSTVWRAVDLLDSIDAIQIRETPQRNYIAINPDRLQKDDPILGISQSEFHAPIRAFVDRVKPRPPTPTTSTTSLGSSSLEASLGEADRQSDIDCFVVVDGNRTTARRQITDVVADLQSERFDGDRFVFEPYVDLQRALGEPDRSSTEIFTEGITVYGSDRLDGSARRSSPMSSTRIEALIDEVQAAFDRRPTDIEAGLDVGDAAPPATEGLSLARRRRGPPDASYYTLVIEASFVAIERTVEFRLLERGTMQPDDLPGTHPGVYREAAAAGVFGESMAADLADLWRDHRAKTYYQEGLASAGRADAMYELATELHAYVTGRSRQGPRVYLRRDNVANSSLPEDRSRASLVNQRREVIR